jgi:hypothetical protein
LKKLAEKIEIFKSGKMEFGKRRIEKFIGFIFTIS